jgi:isopenicillin N synthase-like dioxygenase
VRDGGTAWRDYMPLGGDQSHGHIGWKEDLYVGPEHADDHPLVGLSLHGKNEFPHQVILNMRREVLEYVNEVTKLGITLTIVFSLGLNSSQNEFHRRLLKPEPVVLFRCFKYMLIDNGAFDESKGSGDEGFGIGDRRGERPYMILEKCTNRLL